VASSGSALDRFGRRHRGGGRGRPCLNGGIANHILAQPAWPAPGPPLLAHRRCGSAHVEMPSRCLAIVVGQNGACHAIWVSSTSAPAS